MIAAQSAQRLLIPFNHKGGGTKEEIEHGKLK
jgi:hypothetical protein